MSNNSPDPEAKEWMNFFHLKLEDLFQNEDEEEDSLWVQEKDYHCGNNMTGAGQSYWGNICQGEKEEEEREKEAEESEGIHFCSLYLSIK